MVDLALVFQHPLVICFALGKTWRLAFDGLTVKWSAS
jgi:hypothetical protein